MSCDTELYYYYFLFLLNWPISVEITPGQAGSTKGFTNKNLLGLQVQDTVPVIKPQS